MAHRLYKYFLSSMINHSNKHHQRKNKNKNKKEKINKEINHHKNTRPGNKILLKLSCTCNFKFSMVHPKLYSLHWKGFFSLFFPFFFLSLPKFVPEARGMCMVPTRSSNQFPC